MTLALRGSYSLPDSTFTYTAVKNVNPPVFLTARLQAVQEQERGDAAAAALRRAIKLIMFLWRKWSKFPDK